MTFEEDLGKAVEVLKRGGVIIYPTDTVWGIGCDATDPSAVARIYKIKQRDDSKALITLMDPDCLDEYLPDLSEACRNELTGNSRPTTVICPGAVGLASNLLASDGSLGVRVSREKFSAALCREAGCPIVSTSVNISGQPAPAVFDDISHELLAEADYVVNYRRDDLTPASPSRIIAFDHDGNRTIIRK